ncbi:MAG: hypothetical protein Q9227_007549 [Pyrenula ochraceoflavens]
MEGTELLSCPLCHFTSKESYQLMLHVETSHNENGESPFAIRESVEDMPQQEDLSRLEREVMTVPASSDQDQASDYVQCSYSNCGEQILRAELSIHTDFHIAEDIALEEAEKSTDIHKSFQTEQGDDTTSSNMLDHCTVSSRDSQRARISLKALLMGSRHSRRRTSESLEHSQMDATSTTKRLGV